MRKTGIALYTIFALLFAALPVFVIRMSLLGTAKYEGFTLQPWLGVALACIALCLIPKELPRIPEWLAAPLWGCAAFQWRYHCCHGIEMRMRMKYDFATVLESARGIRQAKEAIFTHWAFYPRILQWWNESVCKQDYLYHNAVFFNAITGALCCVLVYAIARLLCRRQRAAMLAAAIFCFWPSLSHYVAVITNEHMAMLCMMLSLFFVVLAWRLWNGSSEGSSALRRAFAILAVLFAGLSAGVADLFKQFSPVFLIASFGAGLLFVLIGQKSVRGETRSEAGKRNRAFAKRICCLVLAVLVMFGSALAVRETAYRWLEGYLQLPICRNATAHFLWIGLNSNGMGEWSEAEGMKVYELAAQYDNDYDKVMDELMRLLREDRKAHPEALGATIQNKMEKDWEADIALSRWMKSLYDEIAVWEDLHPGETFRSWEVTTEEREALDFDPDESMLKSSAAYYLCVMGLVALGAFLAIFVRDFSQTLLRLVFYGYALLFLLSEAQGRYQVVLFPIFALLAACAAETAGTLPWRRRAKKGGDTVADAN